MSRNHRFLNARRWSRVRWQVLTEGGFRCAACSRPGRLEVDHRTPLEQGGAEFDLSNLQPLCRRCHFAKTASEREAQLSPDRIAWREYVTQLAREVNA